MLRKLGEGDHFDVIVEFSVSLIFILQYCFCCQVTIPYIIPSFVYIIPSFVFMSNEHPRHEYIYIYIYELYTIEVPILLHHVLLVPISGLRRVLKIPRPTFTNVFSIGHSAMSISYFLLGSLYSSILLIAIGIFCQITPYLYEWILMFQCLPARSTK